MNETIPSAPTLPTTAPKKSGCGCCLWGCFTTLLVFFLITLGASVAFWYGLKSLAVPDTAVLWTYEKIIRPKIAENLPPHFNEAQRQQVLKTSDFALKRYMELPADQKKTILKEAVTASYYYSRQQVIPPETIPNLNRFIQETIDVYQQGP